MKKLLALLLVFCLLLPCAALGDDAGNNSKSALTLHDVRYYFEHKLLPQFFYEDPESLLDYISESGFFALWESYTSGLPFDVTYPADDFSSQVYTLSDTVRLLRVSMPKPEDTPLCSRMYFYLDTETGNMNYLTVEYDNFFGEAWFLCGWTPEGTHVNYGPFDAVPDPEDPEFESKLYEEAVLVLTFINVDPAPLASYDPATGAISGQ